MAEVKKKKLTDVHRGLLQRIMAEKMVAQSDMPRILTECKEAFAPAGPNAKQCEISVYSAVRDINELLENCGFAIESE